MIKQEDVYRIGRLGKPHGVKGEVSFQFTDDIFDRVDADYLILEIDGILVPFFMEEYRFRSNEVALIKFEDIEAEGRARELTGCEVFFPRDFADADEENMTWSEIVGYRIVDAATGKAVGEITSVDDATINTLFEVKTNDGGEMLIPAGEDLIRGVDKKARIIEMSLPEGLFDL